jgi:hypothetical protein
MQIRVHEGLNGLTPTIHGIDRLSASPMAVGGIDAFPVFRRALSRSPGLAPQDASEASFRTWWQATGAPDLPLEDLRCEYEMICELAGMQPRDDVFMAVVETPWVDLPRGPFAPPKLVASNSAKVARKPLPADIAARGFLNWMLERGLIGSWSHDEMSKFYSRHTREDGLLPTPENFLRGELKKLTGNVRKEQGDGRDGGDSRHRPVVWVIFGTTSTKVRKPNERASKAERERRAA